VRLVQEWLSQVKRRSSESGYIVQTVGDNASRKMRSLAVLLQINANAIFLLIVALALQIVSNLPALELSACSLVVYKCILH